MSDTKRKEVCDIISEMLDNPDDCGIYGTTNAFEALGDLLDNHAAEVAIDMRERCRAAAHATAPYYTNVCWRIMDVQINATGESNEG